MAPIAPPGPASQFCPRCRVPLPDPKPPYCPNCGMALNLNERPVWLTVIAALGSALLGLVALCLGGFGACVALFVAADSKGGMFGSDALWVWGVLAGAVVCGGAALGILIWLLKKPK